MSDQQLTRYKNFLLEIKPFRLRGSSDWTTHFYILKDERNGLRDIVKGEMGNRCKSEEEARLAGLLEARRKVDELQEH